MLGQQQYIIYNNNVRNKTIIGLKCTYGEDGNIKDVLEIRL